jgi:hypothetical protein
MPTATNVKDAAKDMANQSLESRLESCLESRLEIMGPLLFDKFEYVWLCKY